MFNKIKEIRNFALKSIESTNSLEELENIRLKYLGKKGELTHFLRNLGSLSQEERPIIGKEINILKNEIETGLENKNKILKDKEIYAKLHSESVDITLPSRNIITGRIHIIRKVTNFMADIFIGMGFSNYEGPEIESDYYNFEALNIPTDHASRDMWDSFYIKPGYLLRSHTSPVQIRVMKSISPPLKAFSYGKCYRRDAVDATHSWMFHQLEGFMVDKNVSFANLKGVLQLFLKELFGSSRKARFVPSYFPFTEPSAEVLVDCFICDAKGCRFCKETGWIEIMGAGMIHPKVLINAGIDPQIYSGFAFGIGIERVAMLKYDIDDIRLFIENDNRFLKQF
jgi:phenylalanyl-tRNA synthetase alpha chain